MKKGDLLQDVFKILNWQPATLIVVDDKLNNLVSCMTTLRKDFPAIRFIGIHYKGMGSRHILQMQLFLKQKYKH